MTRSNRMPRASSRLGGRTLKRGFALVISLSLMVLLTVIAVGLLTLSSLSLRSVGSADALAGAKANARLALMLAIGDLQKQAGPDQRITAPGAILDKSTAHPHWTGVWDSWKAGKEKSGGDVPSHHATIGSVNQNTLAPKYAEHRADHFRRWLVSYPGSAVPGIDAAKSGGFEGDRAPGEEASAVTLVGEGSVDELAGRVSAGLVPVGNSDEKAGRFGWWVGDESTKAKLMADRFVTMDSGTRASGLFRQQSPGRPNPEPLPGFGEVGDQQELAKAGSRKSWQLLDGAGDKVPNAFHHASAHSLGLLADVREGGLKRDLSTILERPINLNDTSDPFMLYRFDTAGQERVPIQDLAAYYQLYRTQLKFTSSLLRSGMQVTNPDFGTGGSTFTREYTNLYRSPVPIRLQFLLSLLSEPRTNAEKSANPSNTDTHKLHIGITPAVTFWNPNNVPLAMNLGANFANQVRFFNLPITIRWTKEGKGYTSTNPSSLAWLSQGISGGGDRDTGFTLYTSGTRAVVFEPGQVKVFSLANTGLSQLKNSDTFVADREVVAGWDPSRFIQLRRSDQSVNPRHIEPPTGGSNSSLTFSASDRISFVIEPTNTTELANGSALQFFLRQSSVGGAGDWMSRHFQLVSRLEGGQGSFNRDLMKVCFPGGSEKLVFEPRSGTDIISGSSPFLLVNLAAGAETHESSNSGAYAGRSFASRPFLHASPITGSVFIDRADHDSAYHHGWNWWIQEINSVFDANVSVSKNQEGYYGGGYTAESGSTHVVQQEIPLVPPISIAALSHAHLGGFSLANEKLGPGASNTTTNFQSVTASGQQGLFPHMLQSIGNSYAHPYLAPDQAYARWTRQYRQNGSATTVTLADHSYLANKALWDEYFFSSISPTTTQVFEGADRSNARQTALNFFFKEGVLPNRRLVPYRGDLTEQEINKYFNTSGGTPLAENEISSHLMVDGAFNVNSTSVEAWRAVFSSLKGVDLYTIGPKGAVSTNPVDGTPVLATATPAGAAVEGTSDPADGGSWKGARTLTDEEIDELAVAMVEQVRLRGPFLSMSDLINRRLSGSKKELAVKGALQAALDARGVSINEGFRDKARQFTGFERSRVKPVFPEAFDGPVAYGSAAYVDQADVLRGLAEQLVPRGDTFVIRTYGDSLDPDGKVLARAWCEAVVQRVPVYLDEVDDAHVKHDALKSGVNRTFGRRIQVVSFRYLHRSEV